MRIGVTGHMNLTAATVSLVAEALRVHLADKGQDLTGVSCIARGADSLFAVAVLTAGGDLEVVIPSRDYGRAKVKPDHAEQFDTLIGAAKKVRTMDFDNASREAYEAANAAMLDSIDELVAVWDGSGAAGIGGTADVVEAARARNLALTVIWPEGAARG
ncbi:hypothetical protein [Nonomuraea endophytica]|uniref:hypothetical protein n=1 Tax=Nonomuraea endophytica TaxID=714136 RepID=UPI0037C8C48F